MKMSSIKTYGGERHGRGYALWWKTPGLVCFMVAMLLSFVHVQAQTTTLRGRVTNGAGEPLSGVSVNLKSGTAATSTNDRGVYEIQLPSDDGILVFSYVGMATQEIPVNGKRTIDVVLEEGGQNLDEVVVVGYGRQSRETLTTAISKVDSKVLENVPYANAAAALQGSVSGVRVQSTSGQPGAAPRVIVRGGTSINNPNGAAPLYIIDGIVRTDMNNINPYDIESMQVLKDASSTAIYGARGSNGVVIITTKSGKSGGAQVSYSYDHTVSRVGKMYDLVSAREYLELNRGSAVNEPAKTKDGAVQRLGLPMGYGIGNDLTNSTAFTTQYLTPENEYKLSQGWQSMPDPADPSKTLIFQDNDFQALTYQTGISKNHHLSVSGGGERANFHAAAGYLDNEGTVITTGYRRYNVDLNGQLEVNNKLTVFGRVNFSNASQKNSSFGTDVTFYRSAGLAPTAKVYFEDGSLAPGTNSAIGNPLYHMNTLVDKNSVDNLTIALGGKWQIAPGLTFDPQLSMFSVNNDGYTFQPAFWNGPASYVTTRNATAANSRWRQYQADAVFSYVKSFQSSHNLEAKAGFSYYARQNSRLRAYGRGASTDLIPTLNAAGEPTAISSFISDQVIVGYFGRVNYDYNQKYLLSVNARYDGASNLGLNYRWGIFPGVSLGWNVHKEDFWAAVPDVISRFKLRGSYGVNGNISGLSASLNMSPAPPSESVNGNINELSDFLAQGAYSVGARYNGNAAIQNSVLPNPDLKWEQSKTYDVGADLGLWNDRVGILFDYFIRRTDNLITNLSLPLSTGFSSILTNLGSLQNKGVEFEVTANLLPAASAWQWDLSFNASKVTNKILRLPDNGVENNRVGGDYVWDENRQDYMWKGGLQEGGTVGDLYTLRQIGIYRTDEEAANAPVYTYIVGADKTQFGGDAKWLDSDGNGVIDSRDQVYIGNTYPKWTGGFSNSLSYKGVGLYLRMDYTTGHTIFNYGKLFLDMNGYSDGTFTKDKYENSWKQPGDEATQSRYYWGGERTQRNNFFGVTDRGNSIFYQRGDFLCVREVTLSYTFPQALVNRIKLAGLRLNATGNNLYYFTKYDGLNPEEGGRDNGRYPMPRNFIFSANITF